MPLPEGCNRGIDQPPEQDGLVESVSWAPGEVADLVLERAQVVAQEQGLIREAPEIVSPAETHQAAGERSGVADEHDNLRSEARRKPLAGEHRNRILEQWPRSRELG